MASACVARSAKESFVFVPSMGAVSASSIDASRQLGGRGRVPPQGPRSAGGGQALAVSAGGTTLGSARRRGGPDRRCGENAGRRSTGPCTSESRASTSTRSGTCCAVMIKARANRGSSSIGAAMPSSCSTSWSAARVCSPFARHRESTSARRWPHAPPPPITGKTAQDCAPGHARRAPSLQPPCKDGSVGRPGGARRAQHSSRLVRQARQPRGQCRLGSRAPPSARSGAPGLDALHQHLGRHGRGPSPGRAQLHDALANRGLSQDVEVRSLPGRRRKAPLGRRGQNVGYLTSPRWLPESNVSSISRATNRRLLRRSS